MGKTTEFFCIWCEKNVVGWLVKSVIDYLKKKKEDDHVCPNCSWRVTTIISEID